MSFIFVQKMSGIDTESIMGCKLVYYHYFTVILPVIPKLGAITGKVGRITGGLMGKHLVSIYYSVSYSMYYSTYYRRNR